MRALAVFLLAIVVGSCTHRPCPDLAYYGGDTWRVMDADEIDGLESRNAVEGIKEEVEECVGVEPESDDIRLYAFSFLFSKRDTLWRPVAGYRAGDDLYVVRGLSNENTRKIIAHEYAHFLTDKGHPEIDVLLEECGIPIKMRLPRRPR